MDKKSKIFFVVFFTFIFIVVFYAFCEYFILRDYYITVESDCDPSVSNCFVYRCDPAVDTTCSNNPEENVSYYKLIKKKAIAVPVCNEKGEDCPPLVCAKWEDCEEIFCDQFVVQEGEECSGWAGVQEVKNIPVE